jgi:type I restriction enzyme, S subunit
MDLKPGFQQTEVGVIPEDWNLVSLKRISAFITKGSTPTTYGFKWEADGVLFLRSECVSEKGLDLSQSMYISPEAHKFLQRSQVSNGDILITITGNVGRVVLLDRVEVANMNQHIARVRVNGANSNPYLVYHFLSQHSVRRRFDSITTGQAYPQISLKQVRETQVPLPPTKAEQESIARALCDADALIESLEKLISKKRQIKQGAMQELLTGKKRLPGFQINPGYKQTEGGVIPDDWEVAPLGQQLRRRPSYGINAPAIPFDSRFPTYLRITDINEDGHFTESSKASVEHPNSTEYLLEPGDIVFARTGASVGKSYLYDRKDGQLVYAGFLIRVSPDPERLVPDFFLYFAQSRPYWNWVKVNSMRSGQPGINGREYASLPIPLPPTTAEQEAIAAILSDMDEGISALKAKLDKALKIKQGMMQELLTGRVRLVESGKPKLTNGEGID